MSEFARENYPKEYPQIRKLKNEVIKYSGLDFEKTRDAYLKLLDYVYSIPYIAIGLDIIGVSFMNIIHKYLNVYGMNFPIMDEK